MENFLNRFLFLRKKELIESKGGKNGENGEGGDLVNCVGLKRREFLKTLGGVGLGLTGGPTFLFLNTAEAADKGKIIPFPNKKGGEKSPENTRETRKDDLNSLRPNAEKQREFDFSYFEQLIRDHLEAEVKEKMEYFEKTKGLEAKAKKFIDRHVAQKVTKIFNSFSIEKWFSDIGFPSGKTAIAKAFFKDIVQKINEKIPVINIFFILEEGCKNGEIQPQDCGPFAPKLEDRIV